MVFAKFGFGSVTVQDSMGHKSLSDTDRTEKSNGRKLVGEVQYLAQDLCKPVRWCRWKDRDEKVVPVAADDEDATVGTWPPGKE